MTETLTKYIVKTGIRENDGYLGILPPLSLKAYLKFEEGSKVAASISESGFRVGPEGNPNEYFEYSFEKVDKAKLRDLARIAMAAIVLSGPVEITYSGVVQDLSDKEHLF